MHDFFLFLFPLRAQDNGDVDEGRMMMNEQANFPSLDLGNSKYRISYKTNDTVLLTY